MPTYALQWCAMQTARRAGCSEYDLFGVAPNADPSHPMHGLYRFKTGFGGQMYHQMGCWDYPLDMDGYRQFAAREMSMPGLLRLIVTDRNKNGGSASESAVFFHLGFAPGSKPVVMFMLM